MSHKNKTEITETKNNMDSLISYAMESVLCKILFFWKKSIRYDSQRFYDIRNPCIKHR